MPGGTTAAPAATNEGEAAGAAQEAGSIWLIEQVVWENANNRGRSRTMARGQNIVPPDDRIILPVETPKPNMKILRP